MGGQAGFMDYVKNAPGKLYLVKRRWVATGSQSDDDLNFTQWEGEG